MTPPQSGFAGGENPHPLLLPLFLRVGAPKFGFAACFSSAAKFGFAAGFPFAAKFGFAAVVTPP
jgi:hypothetical protein